MLLRLWLGRRAGDPSLVLRALERHIDRAVSERDDLKDVVRTMENHRRRLNESDDGDPGALIRTEWSIEVMAYALRSHEYEIRNSCKLLDGLRALPATAPARQSRD